MRSGVRRRVGGMFAPQQIPRSAGPMAHDRAMLPRMLQAGRPAPRARSPRGRYGNRTRRQEQGRWGMTPMPTMARRAGRALGASGCVVGRPGWAWRATGNEARPAQRGFAPRGIGEGSPGRGAPSLDTGPSSLRTRPDRPLCADIRVGYAEGSGTCGQCGAGLAWPAPGVAPATAMAIPTHGPGAGALLSGAEGRAELPEPREPGPPLLVYRA